MSCARLDDYKSAVHETDHIAYGVHHAHRSVLWSVVGEYFDFVWEIQVVCNGVGIAFVFLFQVFVFRSLLRYVLHKVGYLLMPCIAPGRGGPPVVLESFLYDAHLLDGCFFGILLDSCVECGVYLQAIYIEVEFMFCIVSLDQSLLAEHIHIVFQGIAEIGDRTEVIPLRMSFCRNHGQLPQAVQLLFRSGLSIQYHAAIVVQIGQYDIAAFCAVLGVALGVVGARGFQQSYQCGCLFVGQVVGCGGEIGLAGCLYAVCVVPEVHRVEVHGQDFLFREQRFQFRCHDPLLCLDDKEACRAELAEEPRGIFLFGSDAEQVLCQLLCDGACSAGVSPEHVLDCGKDALEVNAAMMVEAFVFRGNERAYQYGGNLLITDGCAVLIVVFANRETVGTDDDAGFAGDRVAYVAESRRAPEQP